MTVTTANHHMIAYGSGQVREDALEAITAGQMERVDLPGAPFAVIEVTRTEPVRLHSIAHPFTLPPSAADMRHADAQLSFLETHLAKLCGGWWKPGQRFIADYFSALRRKVSEHRDTLADRAGAMAGLIEEEHWAFSAPMPFPRALVRPAGDGPLRAEDFTAADFAFYTRDGLVAAWIDTGRSIMPSAKRARARLLDGGVICRDIRLPPAGKAPEKLLEELGADFVHFATSEPLPRTPFRGRPIGNPVI